MLPERLRQLRNARNLTQPQLAAALNKAGEKNGPQNTGGQIGNWERGDRAPNYKELIKLADFFDVSVDFLIGRSREDTYDILQILLMDVVTFQGQTLTGTDKFALVKLIESYFNRDTNVRDAYFDEQPNLFDNNDY